MTEDRHNCFTCKHYFTNRGGDMDCRVLELDPSPSNSIRFWLRQNFHIGECARWDCPGWEAGGKGVPESAALRADHRVG